MFDMIILFALVPVVGITLSVMVIEFSTRV